MTRPTLLALWATPRTVSTAFERMMIERGDHLVLDEPWSRAYYFGPERRSDRYPLVFPESTYEAVGNAVAAVARDGPVFVKDMAYQALPGVSDELLRSATNTFLIRDPAQALPSFAGGWPDFTDEEAGYAAQRALFDRVVGLGCDPVVLDSDRIRRDPGGVVAAWCDRVGLPFDREHLSWDPGMRPEWQLWRPWYERVATSTGFLPVGPPVERSAGARVRRLIDEVRDHYEALAVHAL